MSWSAFFCSGAWNRHVLQNLATVVVRRISLRVRFALHREAFQTLNDSPSRVSSSEYWASVDSYWSLYWFFRDQRAELDEEEATLWAETLEVQQLILATSILQRR